MDKKLIKKTKVILKNVFASICFVAVVLSTTACSGSRTGTEITFSTLSLEESDMSEEKEAEGKTEKSDDSVSEKSSETSDSAQKSEAEEEVTKIYVHVCGAVERPGVYELNSDSRVYEGIEAAGGLTRDADEAAVNQAGRVEDGQQIYVYTKEETKNSKENGEQVSGVTVEQADEASSKVNLNTAGKEELMTLTGIGEAKAQAIIDYRESNGSYSSVEEIMKIDGIKQGVFQKIQNDITI